MIKILVNIPDTSGVSYHRLFIPYKNLGDRSDDIDVVVDTDVRGYTVEQFNEYDFVVFNRHIDKFTCESQPLIDRLKRSTCKIIIDNDDLYRLNKEHIFYQNYSQAQNDVILSAKAADYLTVTHQLMADTMSKEMGIDINKFYVVPNGIDDSVPQFSFEENIVKDRIKFGWTGSVTHFEDVLPLYDSLQYLYKNYFMKDKFSITYGGYVKNDLVSEAIAGVLSGKGTSNSEQFHLFDALPVDLYANFYKSINVSLIPLENNEFNTHKSNLKLLESGFHKKAVIVKNIHPYSTLLKDGYNCLVINNDKNWWKQMEKLINNPDLITYLGNNLYNDLKVDYSTTKIMDDYKNQLIKWKS